MELPLDRVNALEAVVECATVLENNRIQLDPLAVKVWPLLMACLTASQATEPMVVRVAAARAVAALCAACGSFMARLFTKEAWPILHRWLQPTVMPSLSTSQQVSTSRAELALATAAVTTCLAAVDCLDAFTAWQLFQATRPWLAYNFHSSQWTTTLGEQVEQLHTRLATEYPDLVWLTLYSALPPSFAVNTFVNPLQWPLATQVPSPAYLQLHEAQPALVEAMLRLKCHVE
jgi:hypothetical protein